MSELINDDGKSGLRENAGRRRFVRGVGVAIPVSLTVSARSALAATCTTVSANASIALANSHNATGDVNQPCAGFAPSSWSGSYNGKTTTFLTAFTPINTSLNTLTMKAAITGSDLFLRDIANAYLNLLNTKVVGFYSNAQLKAMLDGRFTGFNPIPTNTSLVWYEAEIKAYLESTWP